MSLHPETMLMSTIALSHAPVQSRTSQAPVEAKAQPQVAIHTECACHASNKTTTSFPHTHRILRRALLSNQCATESTVPVEISLKTAKCGECENPKGKEQSKSFRGTKADGFEEVSLDTAGKGEKGGAGITVEGGPGGIPLWRTILGKVIGAVFGLVVGVTASVRKFWA